jgi:hypothetical protein
MMRRSTGLALVAIGAIGLLAVHVPLTFVSLRFTGLVLMLTGLTGLGVPQRAWRWLHGHQNELKDALAGSPNRRRKARRTVRGCRWMTCSGRTIRPEQRPGAATDLVYLRFV